MAELKSEPWEEAAEPHARALQRLSDWIVGRGLTATELSPLIEGFCQRLESADVRILRMHVSLATLHPTHSGFGGTWWRGRGFATEHYTRADDEKDAWQKSPLRAMIEQGIPVMRRRLAGPEARLDYPVLEEIRAAGATDWQARLVRFGAGDRPTGLPGMLMSWASDRPGGFTEAESAALERLTPRLGLACYRIALEQVAKNLLDAYVGRDAGGRVLAGQIERGAATPLFAVVFLADLRHFTRLADETPGEQLLADLNRFLGDLTDIVEAHDGEVLKFMGDGLLAIFSLEGSEASVVCRSALAAARAALAGNAALNRQRRESGAMPLEVDIALHLGRLIYGNVGSDRRLDFTVIGPAVNEASRIEALCEPLGCPLLISASFARAQNEALRSLGEHSLRGVAQAQELFTLP